MRSRAGGERAPLESKALPALETRTMADLTWIPVLPLAALNEGRAHTRAWSAAACDLNDDGLAELLGIAQ